MNGTCRMYELNGSTASVKIDMDERVQMHLTPRRRFGPQDWVEQKRRRHKAEKSWLSMPRQASPFQRLRKNSLHTHRMTTPSNSVN